MKIIFFGTPQFASEILQKIISKHEVVCVVTTLDTKKGRGKKFLPSNVKETANKLNIPVLQPENLNEKKFIDDLKKFNADLFAVIAFRKLPKEVWEIPNRGTINLHTSLLPNYRGAGPINWVLINGEKTTGITTFFINDKIDTGDIILQKEINITENMTAAQLHNSMIIEGIEIINKTIDCISKNKVKKFTQPQSNGFKKAPKIKKDLLKINWNKSALEVHNLIRGLSPYVDKYTMLSDVSICPSAWFFLNNKRVKIYKASLTDKINHNSTIDTNNKNYLNINFEDKALSIEVIQMEGKKSMEIKQFLQGRKINDKDFIN